MIRKFIFILTGDRRRLARITDVEEIAPMMAIERLDGAAGRCRGAINLRGSIVPVFDATAADAPLSPGRFILVSRVDGALVGLIVDDVLDVIELPEERVVTRPIGPDRDAELARIERELLPVLEPRDVVGQAR